MKKIVRSIMMIMLVLCLTACGQKDSSLAFDMAKIKESSKIKELFPSADVVSKDDLVRIYDFDLSSMEEYLIVAPKVADKADMYMIIKPLEGKMDEVRNEVNNFTEKYIEQFSLYQPEEASKINNRLISIKGDYLFYIIGDKPNDLLKEFMEFKMNEK